MQLTSIPVSVGGQAFPVTSSQVAEAFVVAIDGAAQFAGATAPNPPVGCVILDRQGRVLAAEAHKKAGTDHAEAAAILACRKAGTYERIDTIVVSLEPCGHVGRTPPCVDAITATPARTVWIGETDPNPHVCGRGAFILKEAGLAVRWLEELDHAFTAMLRRRLRRLMDPFRKWSTTRLPWITIKQALQADGSMIPPQGQKTFSSANGLKMAHRLRRRADAILTGSGTVLADSPAFTVRHVLDYRTVPRHLAILDRRGRTPASYLEQVRARGFDASLQTNLRDALRHLGKCEVMEVLIEAGPTLLETLWSHDLWDEEVVIQKIAEEAEDAVRIRNRASPRIIEGADVVFGHY